MTLFSEIGKYLIMIKGMFSKPENWKMYWKEFMHQCSEIGIGSLGIVVIISVFMGAVSTVQTAYQLTSPFYPFFLSRFHHGDFFTSSEAASPLSCASITAIVAIFTIFLTELPS